jgi:alkylhydroperoxidase/carboxymuconolactone decarboxylase family protein YurZ
MSSANEGRVASGEPQAWVKMPSEAELMPLMENHPYRRGFVPAMGRLLASHPRIGPAFMGLYEQIMFAPGALERGEREMVAAVSAAAQDCFY